MNSKPPIHESDVPTQVWYENTDRELHGKALSDAGGRAKIGFGIIELPAGSNTLPAHYHTLEEEHLYVLTGKLTLHLGPNRHDLVAGSYITFPAGQAVPHYLNNDSGEIARYVIVGERLDADQVVYADTDADAEPGEDQRT